MTADHAQKGVDVVGAEQATCPAEHIDCGVDRLNDVSGAGGDVRVWWRQILVKGAMFGDVQGLRGASERRECVSLCRDDRRSYMGCRATSSGAGWSIFPHRVHLHRPVGGTGEDVRQRCARARRLRQEGLDVRRRVGCRRRVRRGWRPAGSRHIDRSHHRQRGHEGGAKNPTSQPTSNLHGLPPSCLYPLRGGVYAGSGQMPNPWQSSPPVDPTVEAVQQFRDGDSAERAREHSH